MTNQERQEIDSQLDQATGDLFDALQCIGRLSAVLRMTQPESESLKLNYQSPELSDWEERRKDIKSALVHLLEFSALASCDILWLGSWAQESVTSDNNAQSLKQRNKAFEQVNDDNLRLTDSFCAFSIK